MSAAPPVPEWIADAMASAERSAAAPDAIAATAAAPATPALAAPAETQSAATTEPPAAAVPAAAAAPPLPTAAAELDLAFCCDCTGSMGAYIRSAQDNIRAIAEAIHAKKGATCSLRFALVKYRDHPPQDTSYVTEVFPFTKSMDVMKANIDTMAAAGGGDGPEAVTAGLHEVNQLGWRPNASKVCVFIADAPPHGLGEDGDGFPEGCPLGHDPVAICREMASKGIVVYSIGVEPVLSTSYKFARDFMMMVATVTEGKFLPLGKADVLAEVIVSTAIEGLELEQLWVSVEESVKRDAAAKAEVLTAEDLCKRVEERIAEKKESKEVQVRKVAVANPYMDARYDMCNVQQMAQAPSLQAARAQFKSSANAHVAQETASYGWGQQVAMCMDDDMDEDQCHRAVQRGYKKAGVRK